MPSDIGLEADGDVHVFPRYLAGLSGHTDPSFAPVAHWPHHHLDDGPCQLVITSPDHRIRIGWFGDDHDTWLISAAEDAVSQARWTARINQNTPPEIVEGLTRALAQTWAEEGDAFLARSSAYWTDAVQPLLDAGWQRQPVRRGQVEIISPDGLAGASVDIVSTDPDAESIALWAGPPGWATRATAIFTARTPTYLVAATAAALADPNPVLREKAFLHPELARLARLTPVEAPRPAVPTPLDLRRAAAAAPPPSRPAPYTVGPPAHPRLPRRAPDRDCAAESRPTPASVRPRNSGRPYKRRCTAPPMLQAVPAAAGRRRNRPSARPAPSIPRWITTSRSTMPVPRR